MVFTCPLKGCVKIHTKNLMFVITHAKKKNLHEELKNLTHQEKIIIQHLNALEYALAILNKNL
jgi:hypothetical protein